MAFREGRDYQSQAQVTYMNYEPTTHLFLMYIVCCKKKFSAPYFCAGNAIKLIGCGSQRSLKNNIHLLESVAKKKDLCHQADHVMTSCD